MTDLIKTRVSNGIYWVEVPGAGLHILCGCPADSVKHLMRKGIIYQKEYKGTTFESGPNAVLLSDVTIQNGAFANLAEFPVLQMLYRQGMIIPKHPNNTGRKPLLVGSGYQLKAQLQYIYRGNYGLVSEEELIAAGASPAMAHDLMRMKRRFAFGEIPHPEEFIDTVMVENGPVEVRDEVYIQRLRLNVFEFRYKDHFVIVDLNLPPTDQYESPYTLGYHDIKREHFGVIHSGDGDGWDIKRPCMSSVLMYQGRTYLIDAGPNIVCSLQALGIGVSEIEGIFHTHAHDDHFCGLTALMRSDHKIKYYATPIVRASVEKKLSALASIEEDEFSHYFETIDLKPGDWNELGGLDVKPVFSPHPVETDILLFRTMSAEGYKVYAHFADLISLEVLKKMVTADGRSGVSAGIYNTTSKNYLEKADIKKIDVGGGLIHGNAEDFKTDRSAKIILSHTSTELTPAQREIGSGAPFGTVDVLVPAHQDYLRMYAFEYLGAYFHDVPRHYLKLLANSELLTFNPETIILKAGSFSRFIYLILSGELEMLDAASGISNTLSAGTLVGEISVLTGVPLSETYRANTFVHVLALSSELYLHFIRKNDLYAETMRLQEKRGFLQKTRLFGEALSYAVQNKVAEAAELISCLSGQDLTSDNCDGLFVVREGKVQLYVGKDLVETLHAGDYWSEGCALFNTRCLFRAKALTDTVLYRIPGRVLLEIPIVRWKLLETYHKRMEMLFNPSLVTTPIFQWRDEYNTNVKEMDEDHRELFKAVSDLYDAITVREDSSFLNKTLDFLIGYTKKHFKAEEMLMKRQGFPGYQRQKKQHDKFLEDVLEMAVRTRKGEIKMTVEFVSFLKEWIIKHILTEDRKYGRLLGHKKQGAHRDKDLS